MNPYVPVYCPRCGQTFDRSNTVLLTDPVQDSLALERPIELEPQRYCFTCGLEKTSELLGKLIQTVHALFNR